MENILTLLLVIDWIANDIHYGSDKNFYSRHLLADRIRDFGSAEDNIKECYYLGSLGTMPPLDMEIATFASTAYSNMKGSPLDMMDETLTMLICEVEGAKAKSSPCLDAGIHAILDDISQRALRYRFLVQKEKLS